MTITSGAKRGPEQGTKRFGKKRGRPRSGSSDISIAGTKPESQPGKKHGPKPGSKRKGKRGRPKGSKNIIPNQIILARTIRKQFFIQCGNYFFILSSFILLMF